MGDRDDGVVGAGVPPHEVVGQPGDALDVEVVGRLVEQEEVGRGHQQGGERDAAALSAGERADHGRHAADGRRVGAAEQPGEHVADAGVGRPDVLGEVADDRLEHARRGVHAVVLGQHPDGEAADAGDPARVDLARPLEHPQQGGLAAAVAADDADPVAATDPERDGIEHLGGAEREGGALDGDEVGH